MTVTFRGHEISPATVLADSCPSCGMGEEGPVDVVPYGTPECASVHRAAQASGEDPIDILGGCVFGAIRAGKFDAAAKMVQDTPLPADQIGALRDEIVKYYGEDAATKVIDVGPRPWYKNWKIMVPVGVGAVALVGLGVWALKKKKRRR